MTRRCYALWIPVDVVVTLMGNWRHTGFVGLPWLQHCADGAGNKVDLPSDCDVIDATYDWSRKSIGVRIAHHSFPEVPEGEHLPNLYYREVTIEMRKIISTEDDDAPGPLIVEALP